MTRPRRSAYDRADGADAARLVVGPDRRAGPMIRRCRADEREAMLEIVNAAAEAYRGVIPADRWHEPYMPAAEWAIRFYRRHGFEQVSPEEKTRLLRTYWTIPERQVETSVVLSWRGSIG